MSDMTKFSFLDGFELPEITHEAIKKQLIKVGKSRKVASKDISKLPLDERLERIKKGVYDILGQYKGFVKVIYTEKELDAYINKGIGYCEIALDTETNKSTDPLTCKLVGLCLYTPNCKPVYVPVNHCKPGTWERLQPQITEEELKPRIERINNSGAKVIYHSAGFDIRVIKNTVGVCPSVYWDTMIASQLLDENDLARLKYQYKAHINPTMASYNIEALFPGTPYEWIDPEVFALYAAIDPYDTYLLYQYQKNLFEQDGMERFYKLFTDVEMRVVPVTVAMEEAGVSVDGSVLDKVDKRCKKEIEGYEKKLNELLVPYKQEIEYYQKKGDLDDPVNFGSSSQLAVVLYDVMKLPKIDGRKTKGDILEQMDNEFCDVLVDYKQWTKLVQGFTTPLANKVAKDGKIHAEFNQLGKEDNNVRTGRFSSTNPNVQQVPSGYKLMRMVFTASEEYGKVPVDDKGSFAIRRCDDVQTTDGWKPIKELCVGDSIVCDDDGLDVIKKVTSIYEKPNNLFIVKVKEVVEC